MKTQGPVRHSAGWAKLRSDCRCLPEPSLEISMTLLLTASANKADQTAEPLLISLCGSRDHSWQLCSEGEYSCGSSQQDDIRLNISGIQAAHCRLIYRGGQLQVRRERGRIWVHELPVAGEARICEGDVVSLGGVALRFEGVVTAWVRSGRRIDLNPAPESLESATPIVQFIGNSGVPFSRRASLFAAQSPKPATTEANSTLQHSAIGTEYSNAAKPDIEASLRRREQELQKSEAAISRILDELEQTRGKQREAQLQLDEQSAENRLTADILQKKLAELNGEFAASRQAAELRRHELNELQTRLETREQELAGLRQELSARQLELDNSYALYTASVTNLAKRQRELQSAEQQLAQHRLAFDARERELSQLQQQLNSRQLELENSHSQFTASASELAKRQRELQSAEQQLAQHRSALDTRERELIRLRQQLTARQLELENSQSQLTASAGELASRQHELQSGEQQLAQHRVALDARERELIQLQQQLTARQLELENSQSQFTASAGELASRQHELQAAEEQLTQRRLELDARDRELSRLQQELSNRQLQVANSQSQFTASASELASRQHELQAAEEQLTQRRLELDARDRELSRLQQELSNRQLEVANSQSQFTASAGELASRQHELQAAEEQLTQRRLELDARDRELSRLQQELSNRQLEVANSQPQFTASAGELASCQHALDAAEQRLTQRRQQLESQEQELTRLRQELAGLRRELTTDRQSQGVSLAEVSTLQARLADAENGLRERESLIREMYARLAGRDFPSSHGDDTSIQLAKPAQVTSPTPSCSRTPDDSSACSVVSNEDAIVGPAAAISAPATDVLPYGEAPAEDVITSDPVVEPQQELSWQSPISPPIDRPTVPMYLPAGLLSEDLMDLLEPEVPQRSLVTPPCEMTFQPNPSDQQTGPMMYLQDSSEDERGGSDDENGTELVAALAPAEEAARSYVTQLVSSQATRRSSTAQSADTGRSSDSLYADRVVHQLRHNREKPKPATPRPAVSYIEQFLTGTRKLWETDTEEVEESAVAAQTLPVESTVVAGMSEPRQKVDVPRIRREMESFREVASQAATQAVVTHSLKKSRGGLLPRAGLVSVFMVSTVLLSRGPMQLGRVYPPVLWVNLVLLFLSALELARKMTQVMWMSFTAPRVVSHEARLPVATAASGQAAPLANPNEAPEQPLF
jgi:hypothetical protein